jgi:hypothetical protein
MSATHKKLKYPRGRKAICSELEAARDCRMATLCGQVYIGVYTLHLQKYKSMYAYNTMFISPCCAYPWIREFQGTASGWLWRWTWTLWETIGAPSRWRQACQLTPKESLASMPSVTMATEHEGMERPGWWRRRPDTGNPRQPIASPSFSDFFTGLGGRRVLHLFPFPPTL